MTTTKFNKSDLFIIAWEDYKSKSNPVSFSYALKKAWKQIKNRDNVRTYRIKISYNDFKLRQKAKKQGFQWDPEMKVWEKETRFSNIPESLVPYIFNYTEGYKGTVGCVSIVSKKFDRLSI